MEEQYIQARLKRSTVDLVRTLARRMKVKGAPNGNMKTANGMACLDDIILAWALRQADHEARNQRARRKRRRANPLDNGHSAA